MTSLLALYIKLSMVSKINYLYTAKYKKEKELFQFEM